MSSLSSIDKLPNMAAKTDAVSPCKQITRASDVTPVKWGYFVCAHVRKDVIQCLYVLKSNLLSVC